MKKISMNDWKKAGDWETLVKDRKIPFQISEELYSHFNEAIPTVEVGKTREEFNKFPFRVSFYFLAGEAVCSINDRFAYNAFAKSNGRFYYIGLLNANIF